MRAVHPRTGVIVSRWKITSGTRLAYSTDGGAKWSAVAGSLGSKDLFNQQIYYVSFNKYLDKFVAMSGSGVDRQGNYYTSEDESLGKLL